MAAKALIAEQRASHYYVQVHIDTTKVDGLGNPDPAYVREYHFGLDLPPGMTAAQYRASILAQVKSLVATELSQFQAATPVAAIQGQTW